MVRPSSASLNSLARILRDFVPIYEECASILNNLPGGGRNATAMEAFLHPNDGIGLESTTITAIDKQTISEPLRKRSI